MDQLRAFREADAARVRFSTVTNAAGWSTPAPTRCARSCAARCSPARYSEFARMHVADFHRDSGTVLVRTSKAGKVRHIELTTEGLEFFQEITAGLTGTEFLFHRDGAAWGKSHQQRRSPKPSALPR